MRNVGHAEHLSGRHCTSTHCQVWRHGTHVRVCLYVCVCGNMYMCVYILLVTVLVFYLFVIVLCPSKIYGHIRTGTYL